MANIQTIQTLDDAIEAFLEVKPQFKTIDTKDDSGNASNREIYTAVVPFGKITVEQKYTQKAAESMVDESSLAMQGLPPYRSATCHIMRVIGKSGRIAKIYEGGKVKELYQKVNEKNC